MNKQPCLSATLGFGLLGVSTIVGSGAVDSVALAHSNMSEVTSFTLQGTVHTFNTSRSGIHADFNNPQLMGPYCNYVERGLDAYGKPIYSSGTGTRISREYRDSENRKISPCLYDADRGDSEGSFGRSSDRAVDSAESFFEWFRDVPGVNISTTHGITLELVMNGTYAGAYLYETNNFSPFGDDDDDDHHGNGHDDDDDCGNRNNDREAFTFEVTYNFEYDASAGQYVRFKGDDDTWVYINGQLVMDHGGLAGSRDYFVDFNRLGLEDGEEYVIQLFHAERKQPQSQFRLWTNIVLGQSTRPTGTVSALYD